MKSPKLPKYWVDKMGKVHRINPDQHAHNIAAETKFSHFLSKYKRRLPTIYVHHAESEVLFVCHSWVEAEGYCADGCDIIPRECFIHWWLDYEIPF